LENIHAESSVKGNVFTVQTAKKKDNTSPIFENILMSKDKNLMNEVEICIFDKKNNINNETRFPVRWDSSSRSGMGL